MYLILRILKFIKNSYFKNNFKNQENIMQKSVC